MHPYSWSTPRQKHAADSSYIGTKAGRSISPGSTHHALTYFLPCRETPQEGPSKRGGRPPPGSPKHVYCNTMDAIHTTATPTRNQHTTAVSATRCTDIWPCSITGPLHVLPYGWSTPRQKYAADSSYIGTKAGRSISPRSTHHALTYFLPCREKPQE